MIVTVTYGGKPFGSPMDDLREDDLLWFIKAQLELGREAHITPESAIVGDTCSPKETPPPQAAPDEGWTAAASAASVSGTGMDYASSLTTNI